MQAGVSLELRSRRIDFAEFGGGVVYSASGKGAAKEDLARILGSGWEPRNPRVYGNNCMTFSPEVWSGVLHRLQSELPLFSVEAWLKPLIAVYGQDGLRLACPSSFHRDRVRDHYLPHILKCLQAEVGAQVPVELTLQVSGERRIDGKRSASASGLLAIKTMKDGPMDRCFGGTNTISRRSSRSPGRAVPPPAVAGGVHAARGGGVTEDVGDSVHVSITSALGNREGKVMGSHPRQRVFPYTFDNFVVGPCNALAREASLAIARNGQLSLNQVYLTSHSGNGKTHLSRAAVVEARRLIGERALYTSAESFTNEFLTALRTSQTARFKRKYRKGCDVLVIEDIQFLEGKTSTQLEFFHTVQHMLDSGGKLLLTGDRPPQSLIDFDDRIRSQLSGGLVAELEPPDAQVRRNILRSKAAAGGVHLPEECLDLLVAEVRGSVRDLEGVLIQIVSTASLLKRPIDLELTREALLKKGGGSKQGTRRKLDPSTVIRVVASFFRTTPEAMASRSRRRDQLLPRQFAMYLSRRYTDASLAEIGRSLGRDHPAVRNAISKLERAILERAPLRYQVESLCERLDELAGGSGSAR